MPQYLVIQLARFGDLVQTKRLILSLALRGTVHLCVDKSLTALAGMLYPPCVVHALPVHNRPDGDALTQVRATCAALAATDFDAVYNLNHAGFNRVLARLFAPEQVRGHSMHGPQHWPSDWVRLGFRLAQQRAAAPLNLVDFWAHFDAQPLPPEAVNPVAQGQGRGLGVVLAGRESRRSLPASVLAQCVRTAFEALGGVDVFLVGSSAEKPLARQLLRLLPGHMLSKVQDLSGTTDWHGLVNALTGLDCVLSPDTGSMHLAAHLGVPVQAFFLSSAWCHETGPYGAGHIVWQSVYECAPCLESAPCGLNTACLRDFEHHALLRGLTFSLRGEALSSLNQRQDWPEHLLCYNTHMDALGCGFVPVVGRDCRAERRQALRWLLAERAGVNLPLLRDIPSKMVHDESLLSLVHDDSSFYLPSRSRA